MALGRPYTTSQYQLVTYAGNGQSEINRAKGCCAGSLCCQLDPSNPGGGLKQVPAGDPGEGNNMSCEEYPPASTVEGGESSTCQCVDYGTNFRYGNLINAVENNGNYHLGMKFYIEILGINCNAVTGVDPGYACN